MAVSVDIEKKLHGFTLKVKLESDGSPIKFFLIQKRKSILNRRRGRSAIFFRTMHFFLP